jgi:hypothetical protein
MNTPSITLEGCDHTGDVNEMKLSKELRLHGNSSTMGSLVVGSEDILLSISDLRVISIIAEKLADALEFGGE